MSAHDTLTPARAKKALHRAGIDLPQRQFEMLCYYISGDDKATACRKAGFPATASWTLFNRPKLRAAVPLIIDAFLVEDASPAALRALYRIVTDEKQAGGIRVQAANSILDRAGFTAKRHEKADAPQRDASTMTPDELQSEIDKLQAAIDAKMRDITPNDTPTSTQDIDLYP